MLLKCSSESCVNGIRVRSSRFLMYVMWQSVPLYLSGLIMINKQKISKEGHSALIESSSKGGRLYDDGQSDLVIDVTTEISTPSRLDVGRG